MDCEQIQIIALVQCWHLPLRICCQILGYVVIPNDFGLQVHDIASSIPFSNITSLLTQSWEIHAPITLDCLMWVPFVFESQN